jgi:SAM-dependent methyltransferase
MKLPRRVASRVRTKLCLLLGIPMPIVSEDRRVLETQILPRIAAERHRVLFVGCEIYTAHYRRLFLRNDFHTIDYDPAKKRYGARQHTVGSATELQKHYEARSFDAVVFNGVLGYGIDQPEGAEAAIRACQSVLKPGGLLVVGWNDRPDVRQLIDHCAELQRGLVPTVFEPLGVVQTEPLDVGRHVFSFYSKTADA